MNKRVISLILALTILLTAGIDVLAAEFDSPANTDPGKIEMVKLDEKEGKAIFGLAKKPIPIRFFRSMSRSSFNQSTSTARQTREAAVRQQQVNVKLNKYTFDNVLDVDNLFDVGSFDVDVILEIDDGFDYVEYTGKAKFEGKNGESKTIIMEIPSNMTVDEVAETFTVSIPASDDYLIRAEYNQGDTEGNPDQTIDLEFDLFELPNMAMKIDYIGSNEKPLTDGYFPKAGPTVELSHGTSKYEFALPASTGETTHTEGMFELEKLDVFPSDLYLIASDLPKDLVISGEIVGRDQNRYIDLGSEDQNEYYKILESSYDLREGGYVKLQKVETKETIIPWTSDEQEPTKGKDGYPIPADYIDVTFESEDAAKGKVQVADKTGPIISAKVKPGTNLSTEASIKAIAESGYGFLKWEPTLSSNLLTEAKYTAKFIESGKEVAENDPIPDGWVRVKFVAGEGTNFIKNEAGEEVNALFRAYAPGTKLVKEVTEGNVFPEVLVDADVPKELISWEPEDYTVSASNNTFTAVVSAKYTEKDMVVWDPETENKPDADEEGNLIPAEYIEVTFKADTDNTGKAKGTVSADNKSATSLKAMVKPGTKLEARVSAVANEGYGFTNWSPSLGLARAGEVYTAKFVKAGEELGETDPIPADWVRLKFEAGKGIRSLLTTDGKSSLEIYKAYPKGAVVNFPTPVINKESGYTDPAKWTVDGNEVDTEGYTASEEGTFLVSANKFSNQAIVPFDPTSDTPKTDSNGNVINANDYIRVNFQAEEIDGKQVGKIRISKSLNGVAENDPSNYLEGEKLSALVRKDAKWSDIKTKVKAYTNDSEFTFWNWSLLTEAGYQNLSDGYKFSLADIDTVVARFVSDGKDISGEDLDSNPLPEGFFAVNIAKTFGIKEDELFGKTYAVKAGSKLDQSKFPVLEAMDEYKDPKWNVENPWDQIITANTSFIAQASTVVKVNVEIGKEPRNGERVVLGKLTTEALGADLSDAIILIKDKDNNIIGRTIVDENGDFVVGTRPLLAGEELSIIVNLTGGQKASDVDPISVKLNPDRLKQLLPIAEEQYKNFSDKENAFIKEKLENLNKAIETAKSLVNDEGQAIGQDTAEGQKAIDDAAKALEEALKDLTANIPPTINGPLSHEIYVNQTLTVRNLKDLVRVTDADGPTDLEDMDLDQGNGNQKVSVKITTAEEDTDLRVEKTLEEVTANLGEYIVIYTAKDKAGAEVTHEMKLVVKERSKAAIEVEKDPDKMSYPITSKDGKASLDLAGMEINLIDNLGDKEPVDLTDENLKLTINNREVINKTNFELALEDDIKFIEIEYMGLKAKSNNVLRVFMDLNNNGIDDKSEGFDETNIAKIDVIKQPQLDYIGKDKNDKEAFKLKLEGMVVRMTDAAGGQKLALFKDGKFVNYDDDQELINTLTSSMQDGADLIPATSESDQGDNGKLITVSANGKTADTDALRVFYDVNGDKIPDYNESQQTPQPSVIARNVGTDERTEVEGKSVPGAVITLKDKNGSILVTEPSSIIADENGNYKASIVKQTVGAEITAIAKLGEMLESVPAITEVFDDADNNYIPDKDQDFDISKATNIAFVEEPNLTYLVASEDTEVTFDGKDAKNREIFVRLSYKSGENTIDKIYTLAELKDKTNVTVTPALGMADKITNESHDLVGKNLSVALKEGNTITSKEIFAIKVDADGNGIADEDEKNIIPVEDENTSPPEGFVRVTLKAGEGVRFTEDKASIYDVRKGSNTRFADIYNQVEATAMADYENIKWYREDQVVKAEGVVTENVTLTAKATKKAPTEQIVDVTNPDENPAQGYMRVAIEKGEGVNFTAEKYQGADKVYFNVLLDAGVRYYDVYRKVEAKAADGYENLAWYKKVSQADDTLILGADPISEKDTVTLLAKATQSAPTESIIEVIDTTKPAPKGYARVTIIAGDGVANISGIMAYDVKMDKSVRFGDIIDKIGTADNANTKVTIDEAKYTQPLSFKVNGNEVKATDYPLENTELVVSAKLKDSEKYKPIAKGQSVQQGAPVYAIDSIANANELPMGTKYSFEIKPDTSEPGEKQVTIIVAYPDGSKGQVETTITVEKNAPEAPTVDPIKQSDDKVLVTPSAEADKVVITLPGGDTVIVEKKQDQWIIPDGGTDPETGDPIDIVIPENGGKLEVPVDPDKLQPGTEPVEVIVIDKDGKESESTKVYIEKVTEKIYVEVESLAVGLKFLEIKTSVPEATVVVKINKKVIATVTTDGYGRYALGLEEELQERQRVELTADKAGYLQGSFRGSAR